MFVKLPTGECFRVLRKDENRVWVISCEGTGLPLCMYPEEFESAQRTEAPEGYTEGLTEPRTAAAERRYQMIRPAVEDARCITDADFRSALFKTIAEKNGTTVRRVRNLYCSYLATGCLIKKKPRERTLRPEFDEAIRRYYFTAKRNSLRTAYELMLLERYTNGSAELREGIPSWDSFRQYYNRNWSKSAQKKIARDGLSNYQRNERLLYGSAMDYRKNIGCYDGFDAADLTVIREAERKARLRAERVELESRLKMRNDILQIVARAEEQSVAERDITDISGSRARERGEFR